MRCYFAVFVMSIALAIALPGYAQYPWLRLPPTPTLPKPEASGTAPVNGIRLWYAEFGHGAPVILLHGGLANSNYWGLQVRALAGNYHVIVLDSRGHGRSTRSDAPFGYDLMASDVVALMDYLHVRKAALVDRLCVLDADRLAEACAASRCRRLLMTERGERRGAFDSTTHRTVSGRRRGAAIS